MAPEVRLWAALSASMYLSVLLGLCATVLGLIGWASLPIWATFALIVVARGIIKRRLPEWPTKLAQRD
jgi:uncharacterized membrane protein YbaN (DUF454 family)